MIKQLPIELVSQVLQNIVICQCLWSVICLSIWFGKIIDLLATDKLRYSAHPRPMIVKYCRFSDLTVHENRGVYLSVKGVITKRGVFPRYS